VQCRRRFPWPHSLAGWCRHARKWSFSGLDRVLTPDADDLTPDADDLTPTTDDLTLTI